MSDLSTTSCYKDKSCDNGISPIFLILILFLCGGDSNLLGGCLGNNECGSGNGLEGILPILLILCLCGGGGIF